MTEPFRLYLVRHGQTDLNRDRRFRGLSDAPLNEDGGREAAGAAVLLEGTGISSIRTSPLRRAAQTAAALGAATGAPVVADDAFTDIDYGAWQGLTVDEVRDRFGDAMLAEWREDPGAFTFPGGESMASVRARLEIALRRPAPEGSGEAVAVVSHLAVLKTCFVILLEVEMSWFWRLGLENGSVSLFSSSAAGGFVLERWNQPPAL